MNVRVAACCAALYLTIAPICQAQQQRAVQPNQSGGYKYLVEVKSVIDRSPTGGDKVLYEIKYRYEFAGLETVYVTGLGVVPAKKDEVTYLTEDKKLEFRESAGGALIMVVPLRVTIVTQGGGGPELPQESEFSNAVRAGRWSRPGNFSERAFEVIQKYFPSGFGAFQKGQVSYYITTYRTLQIPGGTLRGQVAVMVSQPYNDEGNGLGYRVQYVVRDRPRLSNTWRYGDAVGEPTKTAVADFINTLIGELAGGGN